MRKIVLLIAPATLLSSKCVLAHGGAEHLGHHWEVPCYVAEMRLQMIAMAIVAGIYLTWKLGLKLYKRRRAK